MKVTDASKAPAPSRVSARAETTKAERTAPGQAVDEVAIHGIPDAELTPRVRQALAALMHEVQTLRAELEGTRARINELETLADTDPHLGVLNRRAFVRELNRALAMVARYGTPSSLVFVDLNDLKKINDRWGHAAGDAALERVARILVANIRQTDAVGRLGGDEFGLILTQTDQATAEIKAASLAALIREAPVEWRDATFTAEVACGVVEIAKGATADQAMETADSAMYAKKKSR